MTDTVRIATPVTAEMKERLRQRMMLHMPSVPPMQVALLAEHTALQLDLAARYLEALEYGSDQELDLLMEQVGASSAEAIKAVGAVAERLGDDTKQGPSA